MTDFLQMIAGGIAVELEVGGVEVLVAHDAGRRPCWSLVELRLVKIEVLSLRFVRVHLCPAFPWSRGKS